MSKREDADQTVLQCRVGCTSLIHRKEKYSIYPKYSDASSNYHTCPEFLNKAILLPIDMYKTVG